jgi:nucleoside-diphosphate-sugar epimerase
MNEVTKSIFVTGGTGFLGGALVKRLSDDGYPTRALVRDPSRAGYIRDLPGVKLITGDMTDSQRVQTAMEGCRLAFHVAAATTGDLATQRRANIDGTRCVVEAAAAQSIQRFVHVSTIAVYGYSRQGIIHETDPMTPGDEPYSTTKAEAERLVQAIADAHGMPYSIIRPAMIYGPRSGMWTGKVFRLASLRPTPWIGDGSGSSYPIYVDDVVDLMCVLASHPAAVGEAFNCAPDPSPTWREYLNGYAKIAGHQAWLGIPFWLVHPVARLLSAIAPAQTELKEAAHVIAMLQQHKTHSMAKAKHLLNWSPRVPLEQGIAQSAVWLRDKGKL